MIEGLFGFVMAGLALAGSPGPNTVSLAATGAAFGGRQGLAYMTGIDLGMLAVLVITASGVTGLILAIPGATPVVAILSAAYFLYLAYRIATAPPLSGIADERAKPSFVAGFLLSLVNPKGYAAMAAMFSGFVLSRERIALDIAMKIGLLMAIIVAVNVAWLFAGAVLTRFFRDPRSSRIINVTFAILLIASVAALFAF